MAARNRERVTRNTSSEVNQRIQEKIEESVRWHAANPGKIASRLRELDREWDIERTLETNASALAFAGTVLGATGSKRWLAVPVIVTGFLFQHAVQGWCPPLPILRRMGVRTAREINTERTALKALREDFARVEDSSDKASEALRAARA